MKDKDGLVVLLGNTRGTLQRNLIEPLQELWGSELVGNINSENKVYLFGELCYALGADKVNQVNRLRGSSIKLCFGDEVVTWHREVFEMLKSRLDKPYSQFFGSANPENPNHFLKQEFIDTAEQKGVSLFCQNYTIFDNEFLDKSVVENLCKEYEGSVYYSRFILGEWKRASGIVFESFANDPTPWLISSKDLFDKEGRPKKFEYIEMGVDLGGTTSAYNVTVTGCDYDKNLYVLYSKKTQAQDLKMEDVEQIIINGVEYIEKTYKQDVDYINCDWIDVVINSVKEHTYYRIGKTWKMPLEDRPFLVSKLLAQHRLKFVKETCADLIDEMQNLVFDPKSERAIVLDDGSMQVDSWDGFCYSWSSYSKQLT